MATKLQLSNEIVTKAICEGNTKSGHPFTFNWIAEFISKYYSKEFIEFVLGRIGKKETTAKHMVYQMVYQCETCSRATLRTARNAYNEVF